MNTILTARQLSKTYGAVDVFHGLTVHVQAGQRIALVGVNGAGKTTLLRLLAGVEPLDGGEIIRSRGLRWGYLSQDIDLELRGPVLDVARGAFPDLEVMERRLRDLEAAMADTESDEWEAVAERYAELQERFELAGGYDYERRIRQTLTGLGFGEADFGRMAEQLSGGERTRLALGVTLLRDPDLLLLDEPTNHLDLAAIEWLEGYLQAWRGSLVVISHDRRFLDNVATDTWDLDFGSLETYRGNYSRFLVLKEERLARRQAEYLAQQEHIAKEEAFVRRYRAGQRSREARGRQKKLDRLERLERPREHRQIRFALRAGLRSGDIVLATEDLQVGFPSQDEPLFTCPDLEVRRGERVALIGPNGCGKTTFLRTILDQVAALRGQVHLGHGVALSYYAQTQAWMDPEQTVLGAVQELVPMSEGRARSLLGRFLFSGDDVYKRLGDLSGGERSRVALARLTLTAGNLALLDEPTNHLDIPAREALEQVLSEFRGTLLLVSHDRALVDALATQVWIVGERRLHAFKGNYGEYVEFRERQEKARAAEQAPERDRRPRKAKRRDEAARGRQKRHLADRLQALEGEISSLEERRASLETDMARASQERRVGRLVELAREHEGVQDLLRRRFQEWAELAEEVEAEGE